MKKTLDQKVESLSEKVGGRFTLTTLIIKRMRQYYLGGRTFMPRVHNQEELLEMVLNQVEKEEIMLRLPEEQTEEDGGDESPESEPDITPEELLSEGGQ